jgi:hypothetical protein
MYTQILSVVDLPKGVKRLLYLSAQYIHYYNSFHWKRYEEFQQETIRRNAY